jgi:lipopolysaccharide transport system ATP-binding protein
MSDPVISVKNVSKAYRIWENPASRLTAPLLETTGGILPGAPGRWLKSRAAKSYRDFWALKDVSFELNRGEAVGIIGRNGSGKSTLLQIIAGTLQPTEGKVKVNGRVAALLELGSGFNPEFTGRENVYLNATVLGLSRAEIDQRFDSVAAFADIGDFIEQPVKTYSSGMIVRLAFAVSVAVRPDILVVDEALSVGDAAFQRKCYRRIEELRERGCTFLFVSHDLNAVSNLCSRALLLDQGKALFWGEAQECGNRYQQLIFGEATKASLKEYGDGGASFTKVWIEDLGGAPRDSVASVESFRFCYELTFDQEVVDPVFGFRITNVHGVLLVSTNTAMLNLRPGRFLPGDKTVVKWTLNLPVIPGFIFFSAGCSHYDRDVFLCRKLDILKVAVTGTFNNAGLMNIVTAADVHWSNAQPSPQ